MTITAINARNPFRGKAKAITLGAGHQGDGCVAGPAVRRG